MTSGPVYNQASDSSIQPRRLCWKCIYKAIDDGNIHCCLLDVSAAFDTADHCILLERLSLAFGLSWMVQIIHHWPDSVSKNRCKPEQFARALKTFYSQTALTSTSEDNIKSGAIAKTSTSTSTSALQLHSCTRLVNACVNKRRRRCYKMIGEVLELFTILARSPDTRITIAYKTQIPLGRSWCPTT